MTLSALLLSLSLSAFAQDDDELLDAVAEEDSTEASVPTSLTEKKFFQRVQLGFSGTSAKYVNNSAMLADNVPAYEKYFLKGVSLGWIGDVKLTKKLPLYLELGGMFAWQMGSTNGVRDNKRSPSGEGVVNDFSYKVRALTLTIPISVNYQFKNVAGVEGLTVAPFAGVYGRINIIAKRKQTKTQTEYGRNDILGNEVVKGMTVTTEDKSLMKYYLDDGWMSSKKHVGKLLQVGAQVGANAYYKRYSFGLAYMYGITPFASHSSPKSANGTGCDMEITTRHNVEVNVGFIF